MAGFHNLVQQRCNNTSKQLISGIKIAHGFVLVDVITAMMLFGIISTALISLYVMYNNTMRDANDRIYATVIAADQLEWIKTYNGIRYSQFDMDLPNHESIENPPLQNQYNLQFTVVMQGPEVVLSHGTQPYRYKKGWLVLTRISDNSELLRMPFCISNLL